jgi:hypothetical protein
MSPQFSTPVAVISIAAPEDQHLLAQWEIHLLPQKQNGRITLWSPSHISPGTNRHDEITRHFAQAGLLVLLLSADFFANTECYQLMELALERARRNQSRVIPLLLRSVGWHSTPLGNLSCIPANERPVTRWGDRDEAFETCVESIIQVLETIAPRQQSTLQGQPSIPMTQAGPLPAARHYSCFISYSSQDTILVRRLYADLKARGVDCWFAPHDMKIGARIRPTIDRAIHQREKLLLVLSEHSITSYWVEDEVEAALERERTEHREMLFPIRLDESVTRPTVPAWAARLRRQVNIGDFTRWADPQAYQRALERLIRDLESAD